MNYKQRQVQKELVKMWDCGFIATKYINKKTGRVVAFKIQNSEGEEKVVSYRNMVKAIKGYCNTMKLGK